MIQFWYFVIK